MNARRVLLLGGTGQVGRALRRRLAQDDAEVVSPTHRELDLGNAGAPEAYVRKAAPDLVINAAALSDVDGCTRNPQAAWAVNGLAPVVLARACRESRTRFVHLSTDYVFDGTSPGTDGYEEASVTHPLQVYGRTKRNAEEGVLDLLPEALVVRTAWLFGGGGRSDLAQRLLAWGHDALQTGKAVQVAHDQHASPTYVEDLVDCVLALVERQVSGLIHAVNAGRASRWEFASTLFRTARVAVPVEPVSADTFPTLAVRPRDTTLSIGRLCSVGIAVRPWHEALDAAVRERSLLGPIP
jgi:dTDP-4-dehydrorhamnose reductase